MAAAETSGQHNLAIADGIHRRSVVIDGLVVSKWGRDVFEALHAAGVTAANCTCCVWENFAETMANIGTFYSWLDEHADIIRLVRTAADIEASKKEKRVGIILGFQNTSSIEDKLGRLRLYKELGVGIIQMTYNTQNLAGAGCYEPRDSGLSGFGHALLAEMNRIGIVVDLSHVGAQTSREIIMASSKPVVYSHIAPAALKQHPRNKSDEEIRFLTSQGGFVGVTPFPWFLANGNDSTLEDYLDAIDYVVAIAGENNVGIGTDFMEGHGPEFVEWIMRDKGYGRPLVDISDILQPTFPKGIATIREFPHVTEAMVSRGWPAARIEKIIGKLASSSPRGVGRLKFCVAGSSAAAICGTTASSGEAV